MQVILLERVPHLGQLGDTVDVKAGYARNFLLPKKKACEATDINREHFETRRAEFEKKASEQLQAAEQRQQKLEGLVLIITVRASNEGRLYGSVTANDLVHAAADKGHELQRQEVKLAIGTIRNVGDYEVPVQLHNDVQATIMVQVVAE